MSMLVRPMWTTLHQYGVCGLRIPELVQPVVVDAEVVRQLVHDGDVHLLDDGVAVDAGLRQAVAKVQELKERFKTVGLQNKGKVFNTNLLSALELENMLERAVILASDGAPLDEFSLFPTPEAQPQVVGTDKESELDWLLGAVKQGRWTVRAIDRAIAQAALAEANGNVAAAARALGVTRRKLAYRLSQA